MSYISPERYLGEFVTWPQAQQYEKRHQTEQQRRMVEDARKKAEQNKPKDK